MVKENFGAEPVVYDFMESYRIWKDKSENSNLAYNDFLNSNLENMKIGLDRIVSDRKLGHFTVDNLTLQGGLKKVGDLYEVDGVERFIERDESSGRTQPWTQGNYTETITFKPEEVEALKTRHSGFWLKKKL
ncbi:MAG: hypothetical protein WC241_01605 [Candidatus Paceibacterota bacterium]|jgi:hypothetical protein